MLTWREYEGNIPVRPAEDWNFFEHDGYDLAQYLHLFAQGVNDGIIFREGNPIEGSISTLQCFRRLGHSIHLVTDRFVGDRAQENTEQWLREWSVPYDSLTYTKDKTVVRTDWFLDDKPSNVDALRKAGCRAFLLNKGRLDQVGHPFLVRSWLDFEIRVLSG